MLVVDHHVVAALDQRVLGRVLDQVRVAVQMPTTSMSLRRNAVAAVEITALAAGAGPPANRIATRRKLCRIFGGRAIVEASVSCIVCSNLRGCIVG